MGLLSNRSEDDGDLSDLSFAGLEPLGSAKQGESTYELDDWAGRALLALKDRLETLAVPHGWEGETTLVVATTDEAWVERIMDQVEDELADSLDPELPQVAYDLADWAPADRDRLFHLLDEEAIPFGVEDEELFVHEIDEQRVDELVDAALAPEGTDPATGGGDAGAAMGDLFVAADLLLHEPVSPEGALTLVDARRLAGDAGVPYGMDAVWWEGVLREVDVLLGLLDADELDEDAVVEQATRLRDGLRPYV